MSPAVGPSPGLLHAVQILDSAGLTWVLLRDSVRGVSTSGDIDLLVDAVHGPELDPLLIGAGFRRLPAAGTGSHRFYLRYDGRTDEWIMLDVVTEVAFGRHLELATTAAPILLSRARRVDGLPVLHRDDALWHRLLHYLLDKPAIPPGGVDALRGLAREAGVGGPLGTLLDDLSPAGRSGEDVLRMLRSGDVAHVQALATPLRAAWVARTRRQAWTRKARNLLRRAHLLTSGPSQVRGMTVGILAPDDTGSTALAEALARSVPLPTRVLHMGPSREYRWDRWLRHVLDARPAVRTGSLAVRSLQAEYARRRGNLVLLDQFTLDPALLGPNLHRGPDLTRAVTRHLVREPDVVLLLEEQDDVAFAPKGEQGLPVLERDLAFYQRLTASHPAATVIDGTSSREEVRAAAHRALWRVLAAPRA